MPTAWKILSNHPPCLVRLLARRKLSATGKQVRAISAQEVAIASGLPSIIAQNVMSKMMGGAQGGPPQ